MEELQGKRIKKITRIYPNGYAIETTEGVIYKLWADYDYNMVAIHFIEKKYLIDSEKWVVGVVTQEEYDQELARREDEERIAREESEKRIYLKLKEKFEGEE